MNSDQKEQFYMPIFLFGFATLFVDTYWFCLDLMSVFHIRNGFMDQMVSSFYQAGVFGNEIVSVHSYKTKLLAFVITVAGFLLKEGKNTDKSWRYIITYSAIALALFFFPCLSSWQYLFTSWLGYAFLIYSVILIGKKIKSGEQDLNNVKETFEQCEDLIENDMSINIPTWYYYKGRKRRGYINVVQPQRAVMVLGTPGSGKSFSVYNPFIQQMIKKAYTMFLYDYKFPDLTEEVYNNFLQNKEVYKKKFGVEPEFCVINFDDPRYSQRCNPIHPVYITDPADTAEIADIIMRNINPKSVEHEDFFSLSAKTYIDALIWFLRIHKDGIYCTFPHLIELMGRNYKAIFKMLLKHEDIRVKIQPFMNALKGNAQEQLQGQIASAQIPLLRFSSPQIYWVLSGNDFFLDINNPQHPRILCVGNNPDRQTIYGTTLALYTSRMFRQINHKGKLPCGVLLDELPTIFIKGLDNLIATARSNKVVIVLGAQDKSQLIRDYTDKEAEVIFNTVGNIFAGQVNGRTAKDLSDTFGREFRQQQSETSGDSSSVNVSYQQQEILPQARIETLTQGFFFGKVADSATQKIDKKLFCAEIDIDMDEYAKTHDKKVWKKIPMFDNPAFDMEGVKKDVENNMEHYCVEYLCYKMKEDEKEQMRNDPVYFVPTQDFRIHDICEEKYDKMDDEQKAQLLKETITHFQDKKVETVLAANYKRIIDDVNMIFVNEGVPEYEEEGNKNAKGKSSKFNSTLNPYDPADPNYDF